MKLIFLDVKFCLLIYVNFLHVYMCVHVCGLMHVCVYVCEGHSDVRYPSPLHCILYVEVGFPRIH